MSGCRDNQKVKYTAGSFVGKALTWWNSQIHTRGREAAIGFMSWLATEPKTIQKAIQIAGTLTDEALRNGSIKKKREEMWGNLEERMQARYPSYFLMDCRVVPRNVNPVNVRNPIAARGACFECGSPDHYKSACPRLIRAQGPGGNRPNQALANDGGQDHGNHGNQARVRAFMLGAEEARQDSNIMTGTFTLNDHYATNLFDFGANYSFVYTTFYSDRHRASELGFSSEIGLLGGSFRDIRLLRLQTRNRMVTCLTFDLIHLDVEFSCDKGMDSLSNHKAEIICHEKVVRIPLLDGKVIRVLGERPKEKVRHLMSAKAKEKKQEKIAVVRDFPEVFPDDLSGLPPIREIDFRIELIWRKLPL
ncbi:putative reverse transcriptase domain-containing protein [Tanacetum coccineum]